MSEHAVYLRQGEARGCIQPFAVADGQYGNVTKTAPPANVPADSQLAN